MVLQIKKFGDRLISRPEGRDAAIVIRNQFLSKTKDRELELDFEGVKVLTPSWLDEILQEIFKTHPREVLTFSNTSNASVRVSLETVLEQDSAD
ncbi:MAG: STAS-like domain-containing protein [Pseudobdellovibrionaceae bacterium]